MLVEKPSVRSPLVKKMDAHFRQRTAEPEQEALF